MVFSPGGSQRELLHALIARIAPLIDDPNTHPRDLNSLSFRMLEILKDVDAFEPPPADARTPRRSSMWLV
jgi:hypothetical protein